MFIVNLGFDLGHSLHSPMETHSPTASHVERRICLHGLWNRDDTLNHGICLEIFH